MQLTVIAVYAIPLFTAIYIGNYARWAWKRDYKRGALGLMLIAIATIALPLYLILFLD